MLNKNQHTSSSSDATSCLVLKIDLAMSSSSVDLTPQAIGIPNSASCELEFERAWNRFIPEFTPLPFTDGKSA